MRLIPVNEFLITDDLLATGGTIEATIQLVEELGGVVAGIAFLIELSELDGRNKLNRSRYANINDLLGCGGAYTRALFSYIILQNSSYRIHIFIRLINNVEK